MNVKLKKSSGQRKLIFKKKEWDKLQKFCTGGYPKEVCGLLLGKLGNELRSENKVIRVEFLKNVLDSKYPAKRLKELIKTNAAFKQMRGHGKREFMIDPEKHYQKVFRAERKGLDLIGIFHSHPDCPAKPSIIDRSQPFLTGWSSLIMSIYKNKFKEAKSWFRKIENSAFQEEKIVVE